MKNSRIPVYIILTIVVLVNGSLLGCGSGNVAGGDSASSTGAPAPTIANGQGRAVATQDSFSARQETVHIQVDGDEDEAARKGFSRDGSTITIHEGGSYTLTGTLDDGQIVVDAGSAAVVNLILDGVDITCRNSAAIWSKQADETIITLAEGTMNTLRDGAQYAYASPNDDEPDAALFAKDDLRIGGTGTLEVIGSFNNGIGTKDDLVIEGGSLIVSAANHGIRGRDSLTVLDGSIVIEAGNDGMQSNNDEDAGKGRISLQGGSFDITAAHDGIQAETTLTVTGGEYSILSGGGHQQYGTSSESYKGLKAAGDLTISGGTFVIDSTDDTVHANGDVSISDGNFTLSSGDDGIHADGTAAVSGGTIDILTSYEGIEGAIVAISGGEIRVKATDDGINAAGGTDEEDTGGGGRFGRDSFRRSDDWYLEFTGGHIVVDAGVDGLDSNGNIFMRGGTLFVNGSNSDWSAPLDYDNGSFELSGGTLVAAGSSGMAQAPGESSTQPSLMVYFESWQSAGTTFRLLDAAGNELIAYTPLNGFNCIVVSATEMAVDQSYTVVLDADELFAATLTGPTTYVDETGAPTGGGMRRWGGGGRW